MSVHLMRRNSSLANQAAELAFAVPQVVAHRLGRLAMAGANPSKRDRDEFKLMGDEKVAAFQESWVAMASHAIQLQQQMAMQFAKAFWFPLAYRAPTMRSVERQWGNASISILGKGIEPIRRTAVANAKRLNKL